MTRNYAVFILTHGRADRVYTYKTLQNCGYSGKTYFIVDDTDSQIKKYQENFGKENVIIFNKAEMFSQVDTMDLGGSEKVVFPARNVCFKIAENLGLDYFIEFDDDYNSFSYIFIKGGKKGRTLSKIKRIFNTTSSYHRLDEIFEAYFEFLDTSPNIYTVAMSQGGDYIALVKHYYQKHWMRKAMNVFFCKTSRPFHFIGRINEDVNTYVTNNQIGNIFCTVSDIQIGQLTTQSNGGGMTDTYINGGTYIKSFYSVMAAPSCVKISQVGDQHPRIHHHIDWDNCAVKIISDKYKK